MAVARRAHGEHRARWPRRGSKGRAKARFCLYGRGARVLGCTRACSVACTGARARACSRRERVAVLDTARRRRTALKPNAKGKERELGGRRARCRRQRHLQDSTQPGTKAGITGGAAARWRSVAAHRGEVSGILTWVASGRSAGVGDGGRCWEEEGGGAGRGRRAVWRRGCRAGRGRRRSWLPRVRLLLAGSSGVAAAAQVRLRGGGAAPGSPSSSSPLSPPAAGR
jgi:hypothetical protein